MPEVTKELTNRRWNMRKPTSSGAMTMSVPAAMTPQACAPSAPRVKAASPTVSGRFYGELMTISGHRNSFQCAVTDTIANARNAGAASGT